MNFRDMYYIFDKPVPFRAKENNEILFFPVLMTEYISFHFFIDCLTIDKNSILDAKIISMKYLEYLFYINNSDNNILAKTRKILSICTRIDEEKIKFINTEDNKPLILINDIVINAENFEEIRNIICEQNIIELEDETVQKEIRDAIKKAKEYKYNSFGSKMGSLEDQIICVLISTSLTMDNIEKLSIRKFVKILQREDAKLHYKIYLSASMSGMVEFKDKSFIRHWMSDLNKNNLGENLINMESVEKKLSGKK